MSNTRHDKPHDKARARRRAYVAGLSAHQRQIIEQQLVSQILPHLGSPGIMASYVAMGSEISPLLLEAKARALGWRIAFPRVARKNAPLLFHLASRDTLRPGFANVPEPSPETPAIIPDLIIVPLLAADLQGNRMGQGGGYYDRTLHHLRENHSVRTIGIAWEAQIESQLAPKPWDEPLDAIATPVAFHLCDRSSKARQ